MRKVTEKRKFMLRKKDPRSVRSILKAAVRFEGQAPSKPGGAGSKRELTSGQKDPENVEDSLIEEVHVEHKGLSKCGKRTQSGSLF